MNTLLLNRFAIQCSLSKPTLSYEQIGLIPTLPSVWSNPYNLMVFQGGKLHLFYSLGSNSRENSTARYLMDGTREYFIQNLSGYNRAQQWSTDGEYIYGNNYEYIDINKLNPTTYLPVTERYSGMQRECFCNPFDKKISVMNHGTQLNVWDLTTDVLTSYSVGSVPFANYMILRCEGGLNWWYNATDGYTIHCYDENANITYHASSTLIPFGLDKTKCAPYHTGYYFITYSYGIVHVWFENGEIKAEMNLESKLGLSDLATGFGTGKVWGCQLDPEDRNSLIFISITTGKIYRVKNLPKGSAN